MLEKEKVENSRTIILDKARQLFLQYGYHKVTMRTIAKAAGISTGPVYFYFHNKADIFVEICIQGIEKLRIAYCQEAKQPYQAHIRLREIYRAHLRFYYNEHQYYELIKLAVNPISGIDISFDQKNILLQKQLELLKIKEELIREGIKAGDIREVDPKRFSLFLEAVSEGIFQENDHGILSHAGLNLEEMVEEAINLIGFSLFKN